MEGFAVALEGIGTLGVFGSSAFGGDPFFVTGRSLREGSIFFDGLALMTVHGEFAFDLVVLGGSSCSTSVTFCLGRFRVICTGGGSQRTSVGPSCPIVPVAGCGAMGGAMGWAVCKDLAIYSCR